MTSDHSRNQQNPQPQGRKYPLSSISKSHPKPVPLQGLLRSLQKNTLAELCRQLMLDLFAPAGILIDSKNQCLFSVGHTDRYLRMASGYPTHDVLAMVRPEIRIRLQSAIAQAGQTNKLVIITGRSSSYGEFKIGFDISIHPVCHMEESLFLVSFIDHLPCTQPDGLRPAQHLPLEPDFEGKFKTNQTDLLMVIQNLETAAEEQKAISEEAFSINEEYRYENEKMSTSKEGLRAVIAKMSVHNTQLQETLERQKMTSNDLENILYSTDVATVFLDIDLNIRFFTPATRSLFNIIPVDVGRPLADLHSMTADTDLMSDAKNVLICEFPMHREVKSLRSSKEEIWYVRRIFPYRTQENKIEGVVITFTDITERKRVADELVNAKRHSQNANEAKSRFLAAASHDLRQPLQTLTLLQGMLAKVVEGDNASKLLVRCEATLSSMTCMLDTLLDINQIETGP